MRHALDALNIQHTAGVHRDITPYLTLWGAVCIDAVQLACNKSTHRLERDKARAWFSSDEDYPGSFVWICRLFDLCPQRVRDTLL